MPTSLRPLVRLSAFALLLLLCLACCLDCPGEPETNTCSDGAASADIDALEVSGGWTFGLQGSSMITARTIFRGADIPDCAQVTVTAESVETGELIWTETAAMETEDLPSGSAGRRTKGVLFEIVRPSADSCSIRLTVSAYGRTAETLSRSDESICMQDGGAGDAGVATGDAGTETTDSGTATDGGASTDAGTATDGGASSDAGTATDAGATVDGGTVNDAGLIADASPATDAG